IDLLVNNAGFGLRGPFHELSAERQAEMVRVNCVAPLELMHLALPGMRERRAGWIVNVASVAGFQPIPQLATYAASKAFLLTLSEAVAEEARGSGVRVLALNPGPVATEFQRVAGTEVSERTPGLLTAQQVVAAALAGLEAGRTSVVPGALNRLGTVAGRVFPRSLVVRAAKTVMKRMR
ncbi:MAG TPA: SDR family NAD(P)-dependent oxidoreductase, partial [Longimicrobiaceae bacterium]